MEQINEAAVQKKTGGARLKKSNKKPVFIVLGVILAALAAAYVGLCAYAGSLDTFYPNTRINGVDVAGLTPEAAQAKLEAELPAQVVTIREDTAEAATSPEDQEPLLTVTLSELGFSPEMVNDSCTVPYADWAKDSMEMMTDRNFFVKGFDFLQYAITEPSSVHYGYQFSGKAFESAVDRIAEQLTLPALDASYTLGENSISLVKARDGYYVARQALAEELQQADTPYLRDYYVVLVTDAAAGLTAQAIYDQVAGEMKNAGYDKATNSITPEKVGAEFDVKAAQAVLDAAAPGETVSVPAQVQVPAVTAAELKTVLFRDILGEYTTNVSGTAARKSNVQLSAASINDYVMNTGDVFSYNEAVGQRTAANGYQPAPAYVKGETVDEIGGGICQTSSTLYIACLRGNLEITERYAHRYIPAYVPAGMDATVSWGGPDYKFTNSTNYPIKIVTRYENSKVTVQILGTNVDGTYGRMTNEQLSTTPWETVYQVDETLAPGTPDSVKTTPYTGSKWRTFHTIYDKDGNVLDRHYEATSDYKARNKVILQAPPAAPAPSVPTLSPEEIPANPPAVAPLPEEPAEPPLPAAPEEAAPAIVIVPAEVTE